jgi:hypothetical protein
MLGASFSHTPAKIATTARWLATGPTCSPIQTTGLMSRLTTIEPSAESEQANKRSGNVEVQPSAPIDDV